MLRILKNRSEAEDVLQDVFVLVWTKARSYDPMIGTPAAWLVRIARNRAIDRLRANSVRERTAASAPVPSAADSPESQVVQTERAEAVAGSLDALPREQRELIEHAYFLGLTQSELAERFDLPLGTVKTRIRTGMMALRRELQRIQLREYEPS